MSRKILFVDDEKNVLSGLRRQLRSKFDVVVAEGGAEGLKAIAEHGPFAVIVSDMRMPGMNGVEFLREAEKKAPDSVRMMLTGNADQETAVQAVNQGNVFRFFSKPCTTENLEAGLNAGIKQHELITAEQDLLQKTLSGSIKVLLDIVRLTDNGLVGNPERLRDIARVVAIELGVPGAWKIEMAAMLSPIGMLTVPPDIVAKLTAAEELSPDEQLVIDQIPETSRDLISHIPRLEDVAAIAYYQRKNFDGTGYPSDKVAGEKIPVGARILHVLNDLMALSGGRTPADIEFSTMRSRKGRYDEAILETVRRLIEGGKLQWGVDDDAGAKVLVSVRSFREGDTLAEELKTSDGVVLLAAGEALSQAQSKKLDNLIRINRIKAPFKVLRDTPAPQQAVG